MLTYPLNERGKLSLYEFLYECIKRDILAGALKPHEKMPSKRAFAQHLGISVITIEKAYDQLVAEGYLEAHARSGFFVCEIQAALIGSNQLKAPEPSQAVHTEPLVDLSSNEIDAELFPFSTWTKILRRELTYRQHDLLRKSPAAGVLELREQLADHLAEYRGMQVSPEQIIVGAGSEYLHGLIVSLLGRTKRYAVEDPGYEKVSQLFTAQGAHCSYIPLDASGVDIEVLKRQKVDVMHVSPTHHFPTGITMPINRRLELLDWARSGRNRFIIEDDYDSELRLKGRPIPALASIDEHEHVIYVNTFSKTLTPTIRIGYMVLPKPLVTEFDAKMSFLTNTVSTFEQYALTAFLREGYFERHLNRMRTTYLGRRNRLLSLLKNDAFAGRVTIIEESAGLHFLLRIEGNHDDATLVDEAKRRGLKLMPISTYYRQKDHAPEHIFLINYPSLSEETLERAIEILSIIVTAS